MRVGCVRPRADDDERDLRMSLGDNGVGDVGGDVGLGPARDQELRDPGMYAVERRASSLIIRSDRRMSVARIGNTPSAPASGNRCRAGMESVTAVAAGAPPSAAHTRWYGSSPSTQSRTVRPRSAMGDPASEARSSRGTTTVGSPAAGSTSAVSRSSVCAREPTR